MCIHTFILQLVSTPGDPLVSDIRTYFAHCKYWYSGCDYRRRGHGVKYLLQVRHWELQNMTMYLAKFVVSQHDAEHVTTNVTWPCFLKVSLTDKAKYRPQKVDREIKLRDWFFISHWWTKHTQLYERYEQRVTQTVMGVLGRNPGTEAGR